MTEHTANRAFVLSRHENGVEIIGVNRPRQANALHPAALFQLKQAVEEAVADRKTRGIVITATDPGFVAGASIEFFLRSIRDERMDRVHYYTDLGNACFDVIERSSKPVIAVVNGAALGGGFELALACHYRFAIPKAVFALPETGMGLCPSWGGAVRLPRLVGKEPARWIAYSGKFLSATEALSLKIVDAVFPAETVLSEACRRVLEPERRFEHGGEFPDLNAIVDYFRSKTAEDVYTDSPETVGNRLVASSIRQIKRNSILALKALDEIMSADMDDPVRRAEIYRRVNDKLNRSEDTLLGLTWKQDKKIGFPPFPSKSTIRFFAED